MKTKVELEWIPGLVPDLMKINRNSLSEVTDFIKQEAKRLCPVETGALQRSIEASIISDTESEVSTDMPYAAPVEYGTSKMAAQPFLRPAISNEQKLLSIVSAKYKQELA